MLIEIIMLTKVKVLLSFLPCVQFQIPEGKGILVFVADDRYGSCNI